MARRVTTVTGVGGRGLLVIIGGGPLADVLERPAELVPGAVDVGLNGSQREVQSRRDFLVGPALDMSQHDAGAVLRPETGDRPLDGAPELARLQLVERRLLVYRHVE